MLNFIELREKYSEYKMDDCSSLQLCSKLSFYSGKYLESYTEDIYRNACIS
jgi:hypothetical protein